jgi:hypothetical protein
MATVDYCERCRCKTLHIPLPSGERACEYHLPEPELGARATPPAPARFVEVTCQSCGKTLTDLGVNLGEAEAHLRACRGAARARAAARGYVDFSALFWAGLVCGLLLGACGYCVASYASRHVDVEVEVK